jgi:RecB family exonuclease
VTAWSYSSIKTFEQCPKKYFHLKVAKDVKDDPGEAADYGTAVHLAAEEFVRDGKPIPEKFAFMRPIVEPLAAKKGTKYCELRLGLHRHWTGDYYDYSPCGFFDKDVWYRGIVDLAIIDGDRAWMIDYKTGKSAKYADMKQLDLMAGALFATFPDLQVIKSALAYVVSNEFPKKTHYRDSIAEYLSVFEDQLENLDTAMENGVFNPKSGPLCGWCPVTDCAHWKPRRK